jgi:VIT1/CCC1 family predicted Fe2+/Mn2+ transporter
MARGLIPEPLVTIRRYSSTEPAVADCRLLIDAGIDAYIRTYRRQDTGEVRVPESQVESALALLPTAPPDASGGGDQNEKCAWCGSPHARTFAPFTSVVLAAGAGLIGWAIYKGQYDGAAVSVTVTLLVLFFMKTTVGRLVCAECGRDWLVRGTGHAGPEPEHEQRTENPEA